MGRGLGSKRRVAEAGGTEPEEEEEEEYEVEVVRDHIASSRGSRLALFASDLRLNRFRPRRRRRRPLAGDGAAEGFFHDLVIHPDNRYVIDAVPSCSRDLVNLLFPLPVCFARWLLLVLEADGGEATRRANRSTSPDRIAPENRLLIDHDRKNPIINILYKNFVLCIYIYYVLVDNYQPRMPQR